MRCPYCGYEESKVIDSRPAEDGEKIRRRRECLKCLKRFTTYEMIENIFTNNDDDIMTNKEKFKERVKFIIYNDDVIIEDKENEY